MNVLLESLRKAVTGFMQGRNGMDALARTVFFAAVAFTLIDVIVGSRILSAVGFVLFVYVLFRCLSRDIRSRVSENERYLALLNRAKSTLSHFKVRAANSKKTKYFKCKYCKQRLSVPRGKGRLRVTCPKCGAQEEIRS